MGSVSSIVGDGLTVVSGEEAANDFAWSICGEGGGAAIDEEGEGDVGVNAGDALAAWRVHSHRHLDHVQIAGLHPVDTAIGDLDDHDGV